MSEKAGPQFVGFFVPILNALKDLGGSGSAAEVCDRVIENHGITDEALNEVLPGGQSRIRNQIQWARFYLVKAGLLDASVRGIWSLTKQGFEGLEEKDALPLFKQIAKTFRKKSEKRRDISQPKEVEETNSPPDLSLLEVLQNLPPEGFERVCQRLLRESGFQQVTVTGKSGDGGIDGHGILAINPLVSFNVLFQCKRYSGSVAPAQVRDFRGGMLGRADKGIILTTGTFTSEAKKEARRDGAPPIELVDGEKLVSMFEKLELGVVPKVVYEVDDKFFDEYR
jgi:restriction system protein